MKPVLFEYTSAEPRSSWFDKCQSRTQTEPITTEPVKSNRAACHVASTRWAVKGGRVFGQSFMRGGGGKTGRDRWLS